jgi:glycosyltransferase involved in cell wall biosynthesis
LKKILINGYFLCRKITGIERYALEITDRLDKLSSPGEISLIVPGDCHSVPDYKNISVIFYKKKIPHILWQFFTLQFFLLTHRRFTILEFANTCLPFFPGIIFFHDIYCELFPGDFTTFRDKIVRLYNRWQYRLISKKAKKIITVSDFSREQMIEKFRINPEKISVIGNGWEHFREVKGDYSIFECFPLLSKPYYFSLGSLSKRKNIKWIIDYAGNHPSDLFAISGAAIPTAKLKEIDSTYLPENIIFLGYLDDSKVKALMEKCKAFIMPSYYEGFGIPPMEAMSAGARVIAARSSSLPEIYGSSVHYIDPDNTNVDLDRLLEEPVDNAEKVLKKYSWDISAKKIHEIIKTIQC